MSFFPNMPSSDSIAEKVMNVMGDEKLHITSDWHAFMSITTNTLQQTISNQGIRVPSATTDEIKKIADTDKSSTILIGDLSSGKLKVIIKGIVKTITTD